MPQSQSDTSKSGDAARPEGSPFENFGRKVDEHLGKAGPRIEEEVRRVIDYLNDEVVPEVRRQSSTALRNAANELSRLAEHLERRSAHPSPPSGNDPA